MAQLYNITLYLSYKSVRYDFREKKKKQNKISVKIEWTVTFAPFFNLITLL